VPCPIVEKKKARVGAKGRRGTKSSMRDAKKNKLTRIWLNHSRKKYLGKMRKKGEVEKSEKAYPASLRTI